MLYANKSGFNARIINNYNAYEWLSEDLTELIRSTLHKSKFDFRVGQLLRLALLIEHGGISVEMPNTIVL